MPTATLDLTKYEKLLEGVQEPLRSIALQIVAESGGKIGITGHGGFRSRQQQQKMYDNFLNGGNLAAKPGHSMHERGLAVDFDTEDYNLLAQLAEKHGLINSVNGEPWHYILGGDHQVEGTQDHPQGFNMGEAPNPDDALANRLNAVFSMLGGISATGEVQPAYDPALYEQFNQPDANSGISPESQSSASELSSMASGIAPSPGGGMSESRAARAEQTAGPVQGISQLQQYAFSKFGKYGWGRDQLAALIELWNRESGWNPKADNPKSSAYGIAQQLESVYGQAPHNAQAQIDWGLNYIAERYGSPSAALSFHNRHNFY